MGKWIELWSFIIFFFDKTDASLLALELCELELIYCE